MALLASSSCSQPTQQQSYGPCRTPYTILTGSVSFTGMTIGQLNHPQSQPSVCACIPVCVHVCVPGVGEGTHTQEWHFSTAMLKRNWHKEESKRVKFCICGRSTRMWSRWRWARGTACSNSLEPGEGGRRRRRDAASREAGAYISIPARTPPETETPGP